MRQRFRSFRRHLGMVLSLGLALPTWADRPFSMDALIPSGPVYENHMNDALMQCVNEELRFQTPQRRGAILTIHNDFDQANLFTLGADAYLHRSLTTLSWQSLTQLIANTPYSVFTMAGADEYLKQFPEADLYKILPRIEGVSRLTETDYRSLSVSLRNLGLDLGKDKDLAVLRISFTLLSKAGTVLHSNTYSLPTRAQNRASDVSPNASNGQWGLSFQWGTGAQEDIHLAQRKIMDFALIRTMEQIRGRQSQCLQLVASTGGSFQKLSATAPTEAHQVVEEVLVLGDAFPYQRHFPRRTQRSFHCNSVSNCHFEFSGRYTPTLHRHIERAFKHAFGDVANRVDIQCKKIRRTKAVQCSASGKGVITAFNSKRFKQRLFGVG